MKKIFLIAIASAAVLNATAQTKPKATTPKKPVLTKKTVTKTAAKPIVFKNKLDSASYAFGLAMGGNLNSGGLTGLNYDLLSKGLKDAFNKDAKPLMTEQVSQNAINNLFESLAGVREAKEKEKFGPAIKEGETFLAQNKTKPGIKTTASGLQYEVITEGTGVQPKATDKVTVHYKGTLLNGKQFDSSYDRNEPTSFGLNQVIPGWTEGVALMKEGGKYRFFIPYKLAYGARGAGQDIPPYSTLIFEVELIKVGEKAQ
ncbi:FKBP-type peptidyl-prolyl cis-trans isomerase [Pedobacter sp. SL55]|uniref:FKBP-type peptidyl-prolyl cis-trans isomerase n=1 Tax=Pedobacter sp. SL55 TaxID=2995161 RepID=UPI002271D054|nr:FKBP-type peptidyl-prolyl cis-trans isomerase [Pedobacter sp. SL55]WAC42407.1 FKBP-type peptidyl-prolyl cis-trans isomerase [Pedobacter sp. SL55]